MKERIAVLKLERDRATAALERIKAQAVPPTSLEPAAIKRFGRLMRESVTCGDMPFRKAYRRPFSIVSSSTTISSVSSGESHAEQAIAGNAARIWVVAVPYGDGAPDTIRTCDLCLRRATLYPAELRALTVEAG